MAKRGKKKGRGSPKRVEVGVAEPASSAGDGRSRSGVSMGARFAAAGIKAADAPSVPEAAPEPSADEAATPRIPEIDLPSLRKLVVRRVRKGRGGHTVTIVEGFDLGIEELFLGGEEGAEEGGLHALARDMKRALGCAATVAEGSIVLHGDIVARAAEWLEKRGVRRVVRGN